MAKPQFVLQCDQIKLTFAHGGLFKRDATYLEFLQEGESVLIRKLDYIPSGDLTINVTAFIPIEPEDAGLAINSKIDAYLDSVESGGNGDERD